MVRNTNLESVLFPVGFAEVFVEIKTDRELFNAVKTPVNNYKAIINQENNDVLCVVTKDYRLITNEQALELGKECYKRVFNLNTLIDFEVFNIIISSKKTICYIDIIQRGYEINIRKKEVYLPYIRVTNSYNKTRALSFNLGFCRRLCDNGVIFEKEAIKFNFYHTMQTVENIKFDVLPDKLETLKRRFIEHSNHLFAMPVGIEQAIPLMCKVLDIKFDLGKQGKELEKEKKRRDEFKARAEGLIQKYFKESDENAYAVFNACTDYATHSKNGEMLFLADSMQKKVGNWVDSFSEERKNSSFSLENYIGEYGRYLN